MASACEHLEAFAYFENVPSVKSVFEEYINSLNRRSESSVPEDGQDLI